MGTGPDGIFCVNNALFPDWNHEQAQEAFLAGRYDFYSSDELINRHFMREFSIPLLKRVFGESNTKKLRLISIGCGIGADVEILLDLGYDAWGTDCGSRTLFWPTRKYPHRLIRCTDDGLPFPRGFFDFVMCHQVLEHVGVVGDSLNLTPDWKERRHRFLNNLLRVTKPGGYLNIATPNRLFPIDPGHCPNFHGVRIHGPFDHFLTSYSDMSGYFRGHTVKALTPRGYYAGTSTASKGLIGKAFTGYLGILDSLPFLQGTCLNPLTNVLVMKTA
jgi:SAM-dependent methyltransferase